ncbi:hypothetical protein, partial [Acidithiobacillus ferridurans]|uniref:hypothetical protein n=1 Tax=Acidithiobacillus ferridurans TaxID=1232575 RepID=UPI001C0675E7
HGPWYRNDGSRGGRWNGWRSAALGRSTPLRGKRSPGQQVRSSAPQAGSSQRKRAFPSVARGLRINDESRA